MKNKLPPFVPLLKDTMDSPAWRAMSHGARSLYVALKRRYNINAHNNGRIYLPQRAASIEVGSDTHEITRWYRELQYYGFIVLTEGGYLGVLGKGRAPRWRLTELGCMKEPPTREFIKWNGVKFSAHHEGGDHLSKTESRGGKPPHLVGESPDTSVGENPYTNGNKCGGNPRQADHPSVGEIPDKSILPSGVGRAASFFESREPELTETPVPASNGDARLSWSTPVLAEVTDPEAEAIRRDCDPDLLPRIEGLIARGLTAPSSGKLQ